MSVFGIFKPKRKTPPQNRPFREIFIDECVKFAVLTLGAFIVAFALDCFMLPNGIIDGGVIGVSMMLKYLTGANLGALIFCLNIPFVFLAFQTLGKMFVVRAFYAVLMLSLATNIFNGNQATDKDFLACIFGGIILGAGVGLILRNNAALDGTEILSIRLSKKFSFMSIGQYLMGFNLLIYSACGFMFGWDKAMYAIITYYVASKTIDVVLDGLNSSKSVRIVSEFYEEIGTKIMKDLDVSVTYMKSKGGYSGEEKIITYCVVSRLEMAKVKEIVKNIDKKAFLVVEDVHEVEGVRVRK